MLIKSKMDDFLLCLGYSSQRFLCTSGHDTYVYKISLIYMKVKDGGFPLANLFATPTHETNEISTFSPVVMYVQSFVSFDACLAPQKCDIMREIIIIPSISANQLVGAQVLIT